MTSRWKQRTGDKRKIGSAFKRSWRAVPLAALAVLASGVFGSTASAELVKSELVKEVTDAVGGTVKAVGTGVNEVPLPTAAPVKPSTPSQAATPTPPPKSVAKPPNKESTPSPSQADAGSGAERGSVDSPSVGGVAGAAQGMADSVVNTGSEAAEATGAERGGGDPAAVSRPGGAAGTGEAVVRERRTGSNPPLAVRAADVAALQRWLARVWPAVALGGSGVDGAGIVDAMAEEVFRPALAVVGGLLLASSPVLPASGDSRLTGDPLRPNANPPRPDSVPFATVEDGGKVVYLIVIAALLALLVFTVWREFRIALHPGLR